MPESTPYTTTGPAMMKSFAARPVIMPSVLNSSAGLVTAFAKPVMGTSAPAPAIFAKLSYTPSAVKSAPRKISVMLVAAGAKSPAPRASQPRVAASPSAHTAPPQRKARSVSGAVPDFGACFAASSAYCSRVSFTMLSPPRGSIPAGPFTNSCSICVWRVL